MVSKEDDPASYWVLKVTFQGMVLTVKLREGIFLHWIHQSKVVSVHTFGTHPEQPLPTGF